MDTCIKAGTYCPVCKGIPSADCWHNASEFQRGANYLEKYFSALDQLEQLRAENTALKAENERLKKRCFPSKVLMFGGAGHYVSEAVFVEMERLKAELAEAKKDAELWREREAKIKSLKERGFLKSPLRDDPYKVVMKGK